MKLIGFDLDDTLYNLWDYEHVLYNKIATLIEENFGFKSKIIFSEMKKLFDKKMFNKLFDNACINSGYKLPEKWNEFVKVTLLPVYRNDKPLSPIYLYDWVVPLFSKLREKKYNIVLITNGGVTIQRNKIELLTLTSSFDKIYISDEFLPPARKPDLRMFQKALQDFNISGEDMIYIGDSPENDGACVSLGVKFILGIDYKELFKYFRTDK